MKIALLSFVSEPPHDPIGEMVQQKLQSQDGLQIVREVLRPDLARLKGLLVAALTDPRFDAILVVADLPAQESDLLVALVETTLQRPLTAWQPLAAQRLWPILGSRALWSHGCMGSAQKRLVGALTGNPEAVSALVDDLMLPEFDQLVYWAQRG